MEWLHFILDLLTLGGHGELRDARERFQHNQIAYLCSRDAAEKAHREAQEWLKTAGRNVRSFTRVLKKTTRLLATTQYRSGGADDPRTTATRHALPGRVKAQKLLGDYESGLAVVAGAGAGAGAVAASWAAVSAFGLASTGTAISTLSGAAATNAILAWFGGGSLAVGGGGMAAGLSVLGAVAIVPMVVFGFWYTGRRAEQYDDQAEALERARTEVDEQTAELLRETAALKQVAERVGNAHELLANATRLAKRLLFPIPLWSWLVRLCRGWRSRAFYLDSDQEVLLKLDRCTAECIALATRPAS